MPTTLASTPLGPLLVDEDAAAELLGGVSKRTLFNLRKKGLPFVPVGTRVMYRPADLETWIDRQLQREPATEVSR